MRIKRSRRNEQKYSKFVSVDDINKQIKGIMNGNELEYILHELEATDDLVMKSINDINSNEKRVDQECRTHYGKSLKQMSELSPSKVSQVVNKCTKN